jgi:uncharacterized protein YecE (DUF72 family)
VEVNASFYRLPTEKMLKSWNKRGGKDFQFVLKGSRLITHRKRLREVDRQLEKFFNRISILKKKTGAVLWQLPGSIQRDDELLEEFCSKLPDDHRHVIEFRDESWFFENVHAILENHDVACCIVDCPDLPSKMEVTTDFAYVRFHGRDNWYNHDYSDQELGGWASRIKQLDTEDVYCFFNNDQGGYAPRNCLKLKKMLQ